MPATIIDGKEIAREIEEELIGRISDLSKKMLIIRKIILELSSIIFSAFFVLVSYPITLLALIILPLVNKILKKK